jgi:hypothetical protein
MRRCICGWNNSAWRSTCRSCGRILHREDEPQEEVQTPRGLFQQRHYEKIAEVIRESKDCHEMTVDEFASVLAEMFAADNPNFKRLTFYKACGIEGMGGK